MAVQPFLRIQEEVKSKNGYNPSHSGMPVLLYKLKYSDAGFYYIEESTALKAQGLPERDQKN